MSSVVDYRESSEMYLVGGGWGVFEKPSIMASSRGEAWLKGSGLGSGGAFNFCGRLHCNWVMIESSFDKRVLFRSAGFWPKVYGPS